MKTASSFLLTFLFSGALFGQIPTVLTFSNPNPTPVTVQTSTGNYEEGTYVSSEWVIPASGWRAVTHLDVGEQFGYGISILQIIPGAASIMSTVVSVDTDQQFVRGGGQGFITLGQGSIGTASAWTLQKSPGILWNRSSVSGVSYQYQADYFDGLRAPVTQELFREGVEKIVRASGSGGGGSSGSGGSAAADDLAQRQIAFIDGYNPATGDGRGSVGAAAAAVAVLPANLPATTGYVRPTGGSGANLIVTLPGSFGGATFDFNPFTPERLGGVVSWFRAATEWLAYILLGAWMWSEIGGWARGLSAAQQAFGNPVAAGTGGQATALVAAGLLSVVILTAITALMSFSLDGITATSLRAVAGTNPLTDFLAGSFWMLDQVFPVAVLISCVVARFAFNLFANTTFIFAMSVIRWIVP